MKVRWLWPLLILAVPAPALARAGGRLLLVMYALPMVLPLLGIAGASFGLRVSRSPLLWRTLCVLLGLNSALLGGVLLEQPNEVTGVIFLLAHLGMAGSMLFTLPDAVEATPHEGEPRPDPSRAKLVLCRVPSVALLGVLPGLLIGALVG